MTEVYLIRHGEAVGNRERRYVGRTDVPLSAGGEAQAAALRGTPRPEVLFVSPMRRARRTAELAFPGMAYTVLDDLRETDFGAFEGRTAEELRNDAAYRAWVDGGCTGKIPGGDDPAAFRARVCAAFAAAMETVPDGTRAAFVFHGGGIMAVMAAYARPERGFYEWRLPPGGLCRCEYQRDKKILLPR